MALIVEDGTGLSTAESYASVATIAAYALASGKLFVPDTEAQGEAAARVATRYLDRTYRTLYSGMRVRRRDQALEWPRTGAYAGVDPIKFDEIPRELVEATCEAAIRERASPGSLSPDTRVGGGVKSVTAGEVSVTFADGAGYSGVTAFADVAVAVGPLLDPAASGWGSLSGSVGRG